MTTEYVVWLAVDEDGAECVFECIPVLVEPEPLEWVTSEIGSQYLLLPQGTIEKLIGRKLTWEDEPVEYRGDSA